MLANVCRDCETWQVLAGETSLYETSTIIDNDKLLLVEEYLHLLQFFVHC